MEQINSRSDCNHSLIINLLRIIAAMALGFFLAGCVELPSSRQRVNQKPLDPSPEMLSAFPEADRWGEMFSVSGQTSNIVAMVRPVYLQYPRVDEDQVIPSINFVHMGQQDKKIKIAVTYALEAMPDSKPYMSMILGPFPSNPDELLAVRAKRSKSRFHQPVPTQIDGRAYWVVHDQIQVGLNTRWLTLEIYDSEPTATGPPLAVWVVGKWPYRLKGKFYKIPQMEFAKGEGGRLVSLTLAPYAPSIDDLLKGSTSLEIFPSDYNMSKNTAVAMETLMNETLIEWKSKGLPEYLQQTSAAKLKDMTIQIEKAWAKLDFEVKRLKDAADEDARQVTPPGQAAPKKKAPAGATSIATLIDQRKIILGVILGVVRQTAAQRAMEG